MKAKKEISRLPKWAQEHIASLHREISRRDALVEAHGLLCMERREWFTVQNKVDERPMKLWLLDRDQPFPVCSIGKGDILLIARRAK